MFGFWWFNWLYLRLNWLDWTYNLWLDWTYNLSFCHRNRWLYWCFARCLYHLGFGCFDLPRRHRSCAREELFSSLYIFVSVVNRLFPLTHSGPDEDGFVVDDCILPFLWFLHRVCGLGLHLLASLLLLDELEHFCITVPCRGDSKCLPIGPGILIHASIRQPKIIIFPP